uniref:Aromatic-L-amino-acid decarboxylase n=1 Tax=Caenorhabditis japonica TaxID=281687 RepID=A0A8R1DF05_CAEJA
MDSAKLRTEGKKMIDIVADYWDGIRQRKPLSDVKPGYINFLVPPRPPLGPESWEKIYQDLEKVVFNGSSHWNHPQFFAYCPTGISYHSIMADILSSGLSSIGFSWIACPSITELEKASLDWLVVLMDLPEYFKNSHPGAGCGIIQSSGSDSTLMAIMTARAAKVDEVKSQPTVYKWIAETAVGKTFRRLFYWQRDDSESYDSTDVITAYYHDPTVFQHFVMYFSDIGHSSIEKGPCWREFGIES